MRQKLAECLSERPLALPAAPSGALQPRHPQRAGAFRLCQESLRAGTSPVPLGYVVPAPVSRESIPRTASPGTAEHPRPSGGGCGAEGGERRLLPALAGGARGAPAPGARARRSPGAPCSAAAAAAMKSLCLVTVGVLAMTLLIASISLLVAHVFQTVVDLQVKQGTVLKNGTETFEAWEDPPPPVYMQFYFFNLTNPLEVLQGATPLVEEIGPYTYREYRPRVHVQFLDNGTKVSALNPKTYVFEPEKSVGDPEVDLIRTVNIPAVTAMEWTRSTPLQFATEVLLLLYQESLFTVRSVHELLWGYKDKLLSTIHVLHPEIDPVFGLFSKMNGTDDGEYVFLSGETNYLNFSRIVEWKGKESLSWWTTEACNMINGTDGTSFHPLISKDENIYIFSSDFCRSLFLVYDSSGAVAGVPTFRFVPSSMVFANTSVNPANAGFCVPAGNCPGTGVLNVSVCKQGAPIFLSAPHFYQADPKFVEDIEGMHPRKEYHETFLDINPLTGLVLQAAKRMQVNVHVRKLPEFFETGNIRTLIFPGMYINESVLIDEASASKLRHVLLEASVVTGIPFVIMALGIVFGIVFIVLACRSQRITEESTEEERSPLIRTS
ncbi:lysosome membrane protein 2 isoform 3-T3 [Geothlypis trichas]